jgi:hypothetical protein
MRIQFIWLSAVFAIPFTTASAQDKISPSINLTIPKAELNKAINSYDTVYVSNHTTTYLIFPQAVEVVDIGSKDYTGKIESGNMLFLKPLKALAQPSNFLVRTQDGSVYLHNIAFAHQPKRVFWDYRGKEENNPFEAASTDKSAQNINLHETKILEEKLLLLKKQPNKKIASSKANMLHLLVENFAVDNETAYLIVALQNNSSIPYKIDYVSFAYKEPKKKKSKKQVLIPENEVRPLAAIATDLILPGKSESLAYAIPLYAGTSKGFFEITVREKNGNRTMTCKVGARKIMKATYLQPSKTISYGNGK